MMEHSPLPLSLLTSHRRYVDKLLFSLTWFRMHSLLRKIGFLLSIIMWPVILSIKSIITTYKYGRSIRKLSDISIKKQLLSQLIFGLLYSRPPHIYYMYGLFKNKNKIYANEYITPQEFRSMVDFMNDLSTVANVNDKLKFEIICEQSKLPCSKTSFTFDRGVAQYLSGVRLHMLPYKDLFIKPISDHGGRGCLSYSWKDNLFIGADGHLLSHDVLLKKLYDLSFNSKLLIQSILYNHPYLTSCGFSTLSTVRVLSAINKHKEVILLHAIFKVPKAGMIVDNIGAGSIACPVDLNTGKLEAGYKKHSSFPIEYHPESGILFSSIQLPLWANVLELAKKAHKIFSGLSFAGWDIAITPKGCLLIEGNSFPAVESIQQVHGPLLKNEKFKLLYEEIGDTYYAI